MATNPTREDADQLAAAYRAQYPGQTDFLTGELLDDRTARIYALRDSGYKGPISQDSYPETSSDDARILRDMAARRGEDTSWWSGEDADEQ